MGQLRWKVNNLNYDRQRISPRANPDQLTQILAGLVLLGGVAFVLGFIITAFCLGCYLAINWII